MDRRSYLKYSGAAVTTALVAGCTGGQNNGDGGGTDGSSDGGDGETDGSGGGSDGGTTYGTLATSVTDAPSDIDDFESLIVNIEALRIKPANEEEEAEAEDESDDADASASSSEATETEATEADATSTETGTATEVGTETEDGTETEEATETEDGADADASSADAEDESGEANFYFQFDEPKQADLVQLQGSNTQLVGELEVQTGEYKFMQLHVGGVEGTLTDGSTATVETPGNAPLKFNQSFEIREGERTHFIADFTPVKRGNGSYIIKPVASGTAVLYGDETYSAESEETTETDGESETDTETDTGAGNSGDQGGKGSGKNDQSSDD